LFALLGLLAMLLAACGPSSGPFGEYYVSPSGSDSSGDGSASSPWRTIQYALDNVVYDGVTPPRINLARGIYQEDLNITRSIVMKGVGSGDFLHSSTDPTMPTEDVSVIQRSPASAGGGHDISGDISVEFQDLDFYLGLVNIDGASVLFDRVDFQNTQGHHAISVENSPLTRVFNSRLLTRSHVYSDIAVDINNSIVVIDETEMGRHFDHVINIRVGNVVTIKNSTIWGSELWYADGIRIQDVNEVNILNNRIIRDHPDAEAAGSGPSHNPPYAGIEIAGWTTGRADLVTVRGNEIAGFNVGIGINTEGNRVLIEGNQIDALEYPVSTFHYGYTGTSWPTVDLGGGPLGSAGGNDISTSGSYGFFQQAPWHAFACDNEWGVPTSQIPDRIFDREDDSSLGKVYWDDCTLPRAIEEPAQEAGDTGSSSSPLVEGGTPTPVENVSPTPPAGPVMLTDALCWRGPGPLYEVVSSLAAGTQVQILGRGVEGDWWVIDNPRYPGVRCWTEGEDVEVAPDFSYPDTLFDIPPLPTPTPTPILGCLWYDGQQQEACFPIDKCPVDFENSLGACVP
jgi:hypothetical protein